MFRYLVGIDEVGRGPIAGPVVVGAVAVKTDILRTLGHVKDSKAQTEKGRLFWFQKIHELQAEGHLQYAVSFVNEKVIDAIGIAPSIRMALGQSLIKLECTPEETVILLDGSLKAPAHFQYQTTIIRGDATEPVIALASIVAKVHRDNYMTRMAEKFPAYGFEKHKGYGTRGHYEALKTSGISPLHRTSFLKSFV